MAVTTAPAPAAAPETVEIPVAPAEVRALEAVQRRIGQGPVVATARGMSLFGEHAAGWLALEATCEHARAQGLLVLADGTVIGADDMNSPTSSRSACPRTRAVTRGL